MGLGEGRARDRGKSKEKLVSSLLAHCLGLVPITGLLNMK